MDEVARLENTLANSEKSSTCDFRRILRIPSYDFYLQCEKRAYMLLSWHANGIY